MHLVYLLLGSNQGNKLEYLTQARQKIESKAGIIINVSSLYETQPWGEENQDLFVNQVVLINTTLTPLALLECILAIEQEIGRVRTKKWMERIIDIDILYYDQLEISQSNLTIPHPLIPNRRFTLVPLVEIAPDYIHPVLKKSNEELLLECKDNLGVNKL